MANPATIRHRIRASLSPEDDHVRVACPTHQQGEIDRNERADAKLRRRNCRLSFEGANFGRSMEADAGGTISTPTTDLNVAPGFDRGRPRRRVARHLAEQGSDGWLVRVGGCPNWSPRRRRRFLQPRHDRAADPKAAKVVADGSSGYRDSRLWLEALLRKTPVPYGDQALTVSTHILADALAYQRAAVTKALDPQHIRPASLSPTR